MNPSYQSQLRLIGEVREPRLADPEVVERLPTFRAALRFAINHSGLDQEEVALALGIDCGDFSRMVKEPKHANARPRNLQSSKLAAFSRITGSLAPQQWLCLQVGMEPVAQRETKRQRLERELAELEAKEAPSGFVERRRA